MRLIIGQTVWIKDENNRRYRDGQSGPVYRGYFEPRSVIGETAQSWLLERDLKIDKKTGRLRCPNKNNSWYGLSSSVWTTESDVEDEIWLGENRNQLAHAVQCCRNARLLRHIMGMIEANDGG